MANYDTWKSTDTISDEDAGREQWRARVEDDEREARWREFEAWLAVEVLRCGLSTVLQRVSTAHLSLKHGWTLDGQLPERVVADFADTEHISGVLAALARVLAAQGQ